MLREVVFAGWFLVGIEQEHLTLDEVTSDGGRNTGSEQVGKGEADSQTTGDSHESLRPLVGGACRCQEHSDCRSDSI